MDNLETDRLILINYTLEMIQATINGTEALEKTSGYHVSPDWPGIDFFFYLPYVLENVKKDDRMIKWTRLVVLKEENKIIGEIRTRKSGRNGRNRNWLQHRTGLSK